MLLSTRDPVGRQLALLEERAADCRRENKLLFEDKSPMNRLLHEIRTDLEESFKYRLNILRNVNTFAGFDDATLKRVAENMEVIEYVVDDDIIVQNDIGDSFYVLEMGRVKVMRKANAYEDAHEIRKLDKGTHFGELSLLNEEPRTATITVISATARALKLSKDAFAEIVQSSRITGGAAEKVVSGKEIVEKVPLFKSLSAAMKKKIIETMQTLQFTAGTYICKQGSYGSTFFILTQGHCKVTIDTDDFKEKQVNQMYAGDFFGEAALCELHCKRTSNVIAVEDVTCMTLSKAEFNYLLKGVKNILMQQMSKKKLTDLQALGRLKYSDEEDKLKGPREHIRRITTLGYASQRHEQRGARFIKCVMRFMFESYHCSMYARMYRSLLLREMACIDFGEIAQTIVKNHPDLPSASAALRRLATDILGKVPEWRSHEDHLFVCGLMRQRNALRDNLCVLWQPSNFNELCKKLTLARFKATKRIFEIGTPGTKFYVILRGCVRLFSQSQEEAKIQDSQYEKMTRTLNYERDLCPGEVLGSEILNGELNRKLTALAITKVDLVVVERTAFLATQNVSGGGTSIEDRANMMGSIPVFKGWDPYRLFKISHLVDQAEFNKGAIVVDRGEVCSGMYILLRGRIDVLPTSHNALDETPLNTLLKHDFFGETGFLNTCIHTKPALGQYSESFCLVARSRVQLLVIPESAFAIIDGITAMHILECHNLRKTWREQRMVDVTYQKRVFHGVKTTLAEDGRDLALSAPKETDPPSPSAGGLHRISQIISGARTGQPLPADSTFPTKSPQYVSPSSVPVVMVSHSSGPAHPVAPIHFSPTSPTKGHGSSTSKLATLATLPTLPTLSTVGTLGALTSLSLDNLGQRYMVDSLDSPSAQSTSTSFGAMAPSPDRYINSIDDLNTQLDTTLSTMVAQYKSQIAPKFHRHGANKGGSVSAPVSPEKTSKTDWTQASSLSQTQAQAQAQSRRGSLSTTSSPLDSPSASASMKALLPLSTVKKSLFPAESLGVPLRRIPQLLIPQRVRLEDLEDIPSLVNGSFDPFMVVSSKQGHRATQQALRNVKYIRLPKCARAKVTTKGNHSFFRDEMARSRGGMTVNRELSVSEKRVADAQESKVREYSNALIDAMGLGTALESDTELSDEEGSTVDGAPPTGEQSPGSTVGGTEQRPAGTDATATGATAVAAALSLATEGGGVGVDGAYGAYAVWAEGTAAGGASPLSDRGSLVLGSYLDQPSASVGAEAGGGAGGGGGGGDMGVGAGVSVSAYLETVSVNPDEYVSTTGHEGLMLFGSHKIPSVTSFCAALTPAEKGPFKSNVRLEITDAQLRQMDVIVEAQLSHQRRAHKLPARTSIADRTQYPHSHRHPTLPPEQRGSKGSGASPEHDPATHASKHASPNLVAALGLLPVAKKRVMIRVVTPNAADSMGTMEEGGLEPVDDVDGLIRAALDSGGYDEPGSGGRGFSEREAPDDEL